MLETEWTIPLMRSLDTATGQPRSLFGALGLSKSAHGHDLGVGSETPISGSGTRTRRGAARVFLADVVVRPVGTRFTCEPNANQNSSSWANAWPSAAPRYVILLPTSAAFGPRDYAVRVDLHDGP